MCLHITGTNTRLRESHLILLTCQFQWDSGTYRAKSRIYTMYPYIHQEQGSHHWYNSKIEHNTTFIIGQHDSHSRLLLSPYNASTLTFQSLTHTHKTTYPVSPLPPPLPAFAPPLPAFAPPPSAVYYKKRENKIYYHCVTYATINTNMQNQQNSTTHYSLLSLLAVVIFFSLAHNYNNKLLQQIMHDIINYLS